MKTARFSDRRPCVCRIVKTAGTNEENKFSVFDYEVFGIDFENYSGVLLLRNTYEKDRYYNAFV